MPPSFFNDTATPEISPLPLPDALPILHAPDHVSHSQDESRFEGAHVNAQRVAARSEEDTFELQSLTNLVCRLLFLMIRRPPRSPLFPYPTLFRSCTLPTMSPTARTSPASRARTSTPSAWR